MHLFLSAIMIARSSAVGGFLVVVIIVGVLIIGLLAYEVFRSHKHHDEILKRQNTPAPKDKN